MAQLSDRRNLTVVNVCLLLTSLVPCGCTKSGTPLDVTGQPFVHVTYQGQPLGDVQIQLHETQGGPVLAQSISRQDGNAYFLEIPSPEPQKYSVTIESIGDGGWMLDAKAREKLSESISLDPLELSQGQRIEIPSGAVKQLSSPKRR